MLEPPIMYSKPMRHKGVDYKRVVALHSHQETEIIQEFNTVKKKSQ